MKNLQNRLNQVFERINDEKFLTGDTLGNEIGFWVFDYPAKHELLVRNHLKDVNDKLIKRGYRFEHLNIFEVLIEAAKICSLGDITNALFEVGGQYRRNM